MAKSKGAKDTSATPATNWEELPRPQDFQAAVEVASRLIAARLNANPKASWRIRIDRTDAGPPRIFLKTGMEGRTRGEFFARLAAGDGTLSVADRAYAARLYREQTAALQGKGRPTRDHAALKNPAGQSLDAIIFETCLMLKGLGWTPLARADETRLHTSTLRTSTFDAVAVALSKNPRRPVSYSGIRDAYYRVRNK